MFRTTQDDKKVGQFYTINQGKTETRTENHRLTVMEEGGGLLRTFHFVYTHIRYSKLTSLKST